YASDDAHARGIEAIGRARFPATGGSYNRLAMQSGRIYELQPMGRRGAHTVNDKKLSRCTTSGCPTRGGSMSAPSYNLNYNARAYAIAQNVGDAVSAKQLDNLARVMAADRLAGLVSGSASIHGHRCVAWKDCPGPKMWQLIRELKKKVDHYVKNGVGGGTTPTPPKDWFDMADVKDLEKALVNVLKSPQGQGLIANGVSKALRDGPVAGREFIRLVVESLRSPEGQASIAHGHSKALRDGPVAQREFKKLVSESTSAPFHRQKELHAQTRVLVTEVLAAVLDDEQKLAQVLASAASDGEGEG